MLPPNPNKIIVVKTIKTSSNINPETGLNQFCFGKITLF